MNTPTKSQPTAPHDAGSTRRHGAGMSRISRLVTRRQLSVVLIALVLAVLAGLFGANVEKKLSHGGFNDPAAESSQASDLLVRDFSGGEANLILIANTDRPVSDPQIAAVGSRLTVFAARQSGVQAAQSYWTTGQLASLRAKDGHKALVLLRLAGDEERAADRAETLVPALRREAEGLRLQAAGPAEVQAEVGPRTEADLQKAELIAAPITLILLIFVFGSAVAAMLLLLFLFTGSVLIPLKAVVLNTLSLSATFGAMVWIFQEGHLIGLVGNPTITGALDITIPILMFCVAFGLSMDYEVFLISRIREEYLKSGDNTHAVAVGLEHTGRLISAAAVLMAVVMLAFATSGVTLLKLLGVGMALAVLMDATLVRGVLVPAFMRIAGRANWWAPGPLRRLHQHIGLAEASVPAHRPGPLAGASPRPESEDRT